MPIHSDAQKLIDKLELTRHPEGGYYRRTHQSSIQIHLTSNQKIIRSAGTSIYYLLTSDDYSGWHKFKSDEVWNYHQGSPTVIHMLNPKTKSYDQAIVGSPIMFDDAQPQFTVPAETWLAASVLHEDSYTLVGCAVHPGFEFCDFEIAKRNELRNEFPDHKDIADQFIR